MDRNLKKKKKCESRKEQFSVNRAKKQGKNMGSLDLVHVEREGKGNVPLNICGNARLIQLNS